MTSRNSFFSLLKEDFRRRLWTFILASLVFFGTFPIVFTMMLQDWVTNYTNNTYLTEAQILERIAMYVSDFTGLNVWLALVTCVGAVICGISGFAYLHSKKQMDFYHSLPVKREQLFAVRFVNGLLIYVIPYVISILYVYLICTIFGVMSMRIFLDAMFGFFWNLMGYIILYLSTIIAMVLTGKLVIAFFGIVVLNAYAPAIYALVLLLQESFFVTMYTRSADWEDIVLNTRWLSPFSFYMSLISNFYNETVSVVLELLSFVVMAVLLGVIALWLYKKRPSEKADTAMSFKISEPIVRILIAIPVGVVAGLVLFALQYDLDEDFAMVWLILGSILGALIAHGIIESLYQGDVKKCLSHKRQMGATIAVAIITPLLFYYDVFGYDSYVPKKEEIAHMALASSDLRFGGSYCDKEGGWISAEEFALEEMQVTEFDAMYELAQFLAKEISEHRRIEFFGYNNYYGSLKTEYVSVSNYVIQYTLKDGSKVTREYRYNLYEFLDLAERIYENEEFKTAIHPLFSLEKTNLELKSISCFSPISSMTNMITSKQTMEQLLATYRKELLALTFEELRETTAIGDMSVEYVIYYSDGTIRTKNAGEKFLIYPSMKETIALIKANGYTITPITETDTIEKLTIRYSGTLSELAGEDSNVYESYDDVEVYDTYYYGEKYPVMTEQYYKEIELEITDPKEIAECVKGLAYSNYFSEFGSFPRRVNNLNVEVSFYTENGYEDSNVIAWTSGFRFKEGSVPEFVMERLIEKLTQTEE